MEGYKPKYKMGEWDNYFINLTEQIKLKSKDKSTQIGAIIVNDDHQVLSTGYNSFPRGLNDDLDERQERPEKYFWFEHAERNAIYSAAMNGIPLKGSTMYLSCSAPCMDCARAIVNVGIKKVYCKSEDMTKNKEKWNEHAKRTKILFDECGVDLILY